MKKAMLFLGLFLGAAALFAEENPIQPRVSITSQPSGATVVVDGKDRGQTPITLFDLAPGRHHLKFRLAGYVERDRFFSMSEGPFIEKNEVLEEEKGLLLIRSEPAGCNILLDGVSIGTTPRLVTTLSTRETYKVRLRKPGYLDQDFIVKFDGRTPLVHEEKMVSSSGAIEVTSDPLGAEVTVNGVVRGKTPISVGSIPKGRASIKLHLDGFADETREMQIAAGDVQTLAIALKGLPGTLYLLPVPEDVRFYVNGEARGKGELVIPNLAAGEYEIRAERAGYSPETRTVRVENGKSAREEFRLTNVMGRVEVRTEPVGAEVLLDGKVIGRTKAKSAAAERSDVLAVEDVMEGEHVLTVRMEGYSDAIRHPKVQRGKTATANIRLKRVFSPNVEIVTGTGTYRGVLVANQPETIQVEITPGVTRGFPRDEIKAVNLLGPLNGSETPKK